MRSFAELLSDLQSAVPNGADYPRAFEETLGALIALRNPDVVVPLLSLFDDQSPHDEVMFSLVHGIELFDDRTYVRELLRGAVDFCSKSPRWASIVFMRILNAEAARLELVRQVRMANPTTKAAIKTLMEKINARGRQFVPKTTAVIVAAS